MDEVYVIFTAYPEAWVNEEFFVSLDSAKEYLFMKKKPTSDIRSPKDIDDCGMTNIYGTYYRIEKLKRR